jgi:acyl carrier protein
MQINDFIGKFAEQFENNADVSSLTPSTRFRDVDGWDSMTTLLVIAMADEEYGVRLTGDDIRNSSTVEDLFNIVKERMSK